jgi:L-histidine N-alpha-methyltransferase
MRQARAAAPRQDYCVPVAPVRHVPDLAGDARSGLLAAPRSLPPKYFYDDSGSRLFEQICATPEYYLTRLELALLQGHAADIIGASSPERILELGSGSSRKTRTLLDACAALQCRCLYAPFDICESALIEAAGELRAEFHWLQVTPLLGDYQAGLDNLPAFDGRTLFAWLGSTIGNLTRGQAAQFLGDLHGCMQSGDCLLLGADRVKDREVLHAAYNDGAGITARFNLNLLQVLNRELGADFIPARFAHEAVFNEDLGRIEMYLVSLADHAVTLHRLNTSIRLVRGERILTELSCKYRREELEEMLAACGLSIVRHFEAPGAWYSLLLAAKP